MVKIFTLNHNEMNFYHVLKISVNLLLKPDLFRIINVARV